MVIAATGFFGLAALTAVAHAHVTRRFAVSLIFIGFGTVTLLTTANGYVQTTVPGELRGRVLALYMALLMGGTLIGAPIIGWVADAFGPRWGLGVAAIAATTGFVIGACWMFFSRGVRLVRVPQTRWRFAVASVEAADAIAVGDRVTLPGRPAPVTDAAPAASRHPLPEDFSDELALTSPIPLPKLPPRDPHAPRARARAHRAAAAHELTTRVGLRAAQGASQAPARRLPHDEFGLEHHVLALEPGARCSLAQHEVDRGVADEGCGLTDRRQRHHGGRGEVDVVVADEGDVVGDADVAEHVQRLQHAHREEVVGREHRVGPIAGLARLQRLRPRLGPAAPRASRCR